MKNGLVFAALLFSGGLRDVSATGLAVLAFLSFCLASSAVYSFNDALDAREDRVHPRKRHRPVAAGLIRPSGAKRLAVLLAGGALAIALVVGVVLAGVVLLYLAINLLYSVKLKHAVLLDIMAVAAGFVLRAVGGAVAIRVEMSLWFLVTIPLLSLFLAAAKRRHELVLMDAASQHRPVLGEYSTQLLDQLLAALSAAVLMAYFLYAKDTAKPQLSMLTSPLVVYGIFRYLYLVYKRAGGGSPDEALLRDIPLLVTVSAWVVFTILIIYVL